VVTVDVAPDGNNPPVPPSAPVTLPGGSEDSAYIVSAAVLLTGYTDAIDQVLSVRDLVADHGTVVDHGNGTYTITPAANYNGQVILNYTVSDGHGATRRPRRASA